MTRPLVLRLGSAVLTAMMGLTAALSIARAESVGTEHTLVPPIPAGSFFTTSVLTDDTAALSRTKTVSATWPTPTGVGPSAPDASQPVMTPERFDALTQSGETTTQSTLLSAPLASASGGTGQMAMMSGATEVAGSVAGELSVGPSGGASYTVPLDVPGGTAGMQPNLSLNYSSHSGNGLLGMGWGIGGLSTIHRCPQTVVQDGAAALQEISYTSEDRFCLDGQRLILVNGSATLGEGDDGAEYRTEIETFSRITAHGTAGTGPAYWTVRTKSGQTLEYGKAASGNSRIEIHSLTTADGTVREWAVDTITDSVGNYLTIDYVHQRQLPPASHRVFKAHER